MNHQHRSQHPWPSIIRLPAIATANPWAPSKGGNPNDGFTNIWELVCKQTTLSLNQKTKHWIRWNMMQYFHWHSIDTQTTAAAPALLDLFLAEDIFDDHNSILLQIIQPTSGFEAYDEYGNGHKDSWPPCSGKRPAHAASILFVADSPQ